MSITKAAALVALLAAVPCDGFGVTPSLAPLSRSSARSMGGSALLRSGAAKPSLLGLSLSSGAPPKTMDKYRLEAVGTSLATSDSGKVQGIPVELHIFH